MRIKSIAGLLLLVLTLAGFNSGCSEIIDSPSEGLGLGSRAPSFTLPNYISGKDVSFPADFRGRKVLLFFLTFG